MGRDGVVRSSKRIIRVTPSLTDLTAMTDGDVLFSGAEIPNAVLEKGGCSKLIAAFAVTETYAVFDAHIVVTEKTVSLGSPNATSNVAFDDLVAANVLGNLKAFATGDTNADIDNANISQLSSMGLDGIHEFSLPILLQAEAGGTSIYFGAVLADDYDASNADSIQFIFHIED
tara:strand:- start:1082 stop:1600 length:519 start_codon:yes stop_codon:yes gene_type:complete